MQNTAAPGTQSRLGSSLFSGVKRDRPDLFGDLLQLPTPLPLSASKKHFFSEPPFPKSTERTDSICSPAAKMIKRENTTPVKMELASCKREAVSSDESEGEEDSSEHSPSSNSSSQGGNSRHNRNTEQQPQCGNTGDGVAAAGALKSGSNCYDAFNNSIPRLFSIDNGKTGQGPQLKPFCYNCKRFGHLKQRCYSAWYHWWPSEYLCRYPWLRKRIREAGQLRWRRRMAEYRKSVKKIEEDVEEADTKKQQFFLQYRTNSNKNRGNGRPRYWNSTAQSRADGQKILRAMRRTSPTSPTPSCCPKEYQFTFDCQRLLEELQQQVNQLRFTLTSIRAGSSSPP